VIYETRAFILESSGRREADRIFSLYTEEFGMIRASAQAVRKMESKLRPHLADISLVHVSLVRGKEVWRIVAADRERELPDLGAPCGAAFVRAAKLILRLVRGERADPKLFAILSSAYVMLFEVGADPLSFEIGLVLKILHELGYVDPKDPFDDFLKDPEFSITTLSRFTPFARRAVALVNTSLRETQL
jgi:recombinational DNA repair protein (RecF pathway)